MSESVIRNKNVGKICREEQTNTSYQIPPIDVHDNRSNYNLILGRRESCCLFSRHFVIQCV
jgi:hypothetical protein